MFKGEYNDNLSICCNYKKMKMRNVLTILLHVNSIIAIGQSNINFGQIVNIWTEGQIDKSGKVILADIKRGGAYHLKLNKDTTAIIWRPIYMWLRT